MVLEPLNTLHNHPGVILTKTSHSYRLCKHVYSPSCKILYDAYHQAITEGNMNPNIERAWDEIPYFQLGEHPGRNEPGTGEINYRHIFKYRSEERRVGKECRMQSGRCEERVNRRDTEMA